MSNELIAPSQRSRAALVRLAAVAVAVLLISLLVLNNSRAAFTDTTQATGTWSAGEVKLTQDGGSVLFDVDGLMPGAVESETVTVTYEDESTVDLVDVRLYGEDFSDNGLADHLKLTVEVGGSTVYEGVLTDFASAQAQDPHTDFDSGADTWDDVAPGDDRTYTFTVEFVDGQNVDEAQGADASIRFVWEAQSQ